MDEVTAIATVAVLTSLALSLWVYRDSKKRGNAPLNWAARRVFHRGLYGRPHAFQSGSALALTRS
jgi:hypothetical protein